MPQGVYTRPPYVVRFWRKVDRNGPIPEHVPELGPCWVWTASTAGGYGQFACPLDRRAHRASWKIHYGEIPEDLCVLHRCDNRACVRPEHLFLGTKTDNSVDKVAKGRQSRGEATGLAKITRPAAEEIRRRYSAGGCSQRHLADEFGVSQTQVSRIVRRARWA